MKVYKTRNFLLLCKHKMNMRIIRQAGHNFSKIFLCMIDIEDSATVYSVVIMKNVGGKCYLFGARRHITLFTGYVLLSGLPKNSFKFMRF